MDKLEKALQKARQQREHAPAPNPRPVRAQAAFSGQSATVTLFEDTLEANRIVSHKTRDAIADTFRLLRTQTLQAMTRMGARTLAVTSPNYGDGKTTLALNLAISIAQDMKQTVLLVDLDLRKPCIHSYLGLTPAHGLTDYLKGGMDLGACMERLPFERMTVLPAGSRRDQSSEILGSPQMATLAQELKERYPDRIVIYDMPPLLAQDDPLAFLPHIDSILMVVQEGATTSEDIRRSLEILDPAKIIGTALNQRK